MNFHYSNSYRLRIPFKN